MTGPSAASHTWTAGAPGPGRGARASAGQTPDSAGPSGAARAHSLPGGAASTPVPLAAWPRDW